MKHYYLKNAIAIGLIIMLASGVLYARVKGVVSLEREAKLVMSGGATVPKPIRKTAILLPPDKMEPFYYEETSPGPPLAECGPMKAQRLSVHT